MMETRIEKAVEKNIQDVIVHRRLHVHTAIMQE